MTQVRARRPPSPRAAPLLSADGAEEEGVTKARGLGVIRKGHMSCFGPPALTPAGRCQRPSRGQEPKRDGEKASEMLFSHTGTSLTPAAADMQSAGMRLGQRRRGEGGREEERERQTETEGQVEFRGDFLPGVSHCRKAKLLPDLQSVPTPVPALPASLSSALLPSIHPSIFSFFFPLILCLFGPFFIAALAAAGLAGRRGTGSLCLWGSSL